MEKLISFLTLFLLTISATSITLAADENTSFLEALAKTSVVGDYKSIEAISGSFSIEEFGETIEATYSLSANSAVDSDSLSSSSQINGRLNLKVDSKESAYKPFDELNIVISGNAIAKDGQDIYVKLNDLTVNMKGGNEYMQDDIEELKMLADNYKDMWFRFSATGLEDLGLEYYYGVDVLESDQYKEYEKLAEEDPKNAIKEMVKMSLVDMDIFSEQEIEDALKIVDLFFATNFFSEREIVSGYNEGMTFFNFNRSEVINFFEKVGGVIGENLSASEMEEVRNVLGKISLSGIYGINDENGVLDNFFVRLNLRGLEGVNMTLNYRLKLRAFDQQNIINAPKDYEDVSDLLTPRPYDVYENDFYYEDSCEQYDEYGFCIDIDEEITPEIKYELPEYEKIDVGLDDDAVMGNSEAPVAIVVFSDFQDPFHARFFKETFPQIKENYIDSGQVKYIFRDFPLVFHENANAVANAAECIRAQGGDELFFAYHDVLFENQSDLSNEKLKEYAEAFGVDKFEFNNCLDNEYYNNEIQNDLDEGEEYGVTGTPAFFVNGRHIPGAQPYYVFEAAIEDALND